MDKHDRPYRCPQPQCARLQGFTYSGGLLRHEREVHGRYSGSRAKLQCTVPECKRHSGKGFTRKENLDEHLRRVHGITANSSATTIDDLKHQVPADDVWNEAQRDANREESSNAGGNTHLTAIQPDATTDFSWLSQHANSHEYLEQQQDHWARSQPSHKLQESLQFARQLPPPLRVKTDQSIQTQTLPRSESSLPSWPRSESRAYTPTTRVTTEQPYTPDSHAHPENCHASSATSLHAPYEFTDPAYTDQSLVYTHQANYTMPMNIDHHEYQHRATRAESVAQEMSSKHDCLQDMDETIESHSRLGTAPPQLEKTDASGSPDRSSAQSCSLNQHSSNMHALDNIAKAGIVSSSVLSGKIASEHAESPGDGTESCPDTCPSIGTSNPDGPEPSEMDSAPGCDPITSQRQTETKKLRATADLFAKAEADLRCLEVGIQSLEGCSDLGSDISRSESDTNVKTGILTQLMNSWRDCSDTCDGDHERTEGGSSARTDTCTNTAFLEGSAHSDSTALNKRQKRKQPHSSDDDDTRALVTVSEKRSKATSKRFICCFQNGPGRKCSGTDETISEVIKKLSDWHDTHVCDHCWVLKVKDKQSGRFVHPDNEEMCQDYCLSPQCHSASPNIAHRHKFDQRTCGTKTSRVRPGDSEAVFRFIFQLVHPALQAPLIVFTDEYKLHLDAVPRQCRRKPNFEEVTAAANDLRQDLQELGRRLKAEVDEKKRLELEVAELKRRTEKHDEKIANSEARTRRIIAILGDALRTGRFPDQAGHFSLLERTQEDAPSALNFRTQALLTPTASNNSSWSTTTPLVDGTSMTGSEQGHINNPSQASHQDACLEMASSGGIDITTVPQSMNGPCLSGFGFNDSWPNYLIDSRNYEEMQ